MSVRWSFRSRLVMGSVLWTLGLITFVSVLLIVFLAQHPVPHRVALGWLVATPLAVTLSIGVGCMLAGAWQIRRSLAAADQLRARLAAVRRGQSQQVEGSYPSEVQPLVDDLNALLAEREQRVQRAVARAGDLAHGLKTPLAVLARDAGRAIASGDAALAESIGAQVEHMRRQVDYHLAHARASAAVAAPGVRTLVAPSMQALVRTLERLYSERPLLIEQDIDPGHAVRCRREDLEEMLGNLLENACKWAHSHIAVSSTQRNGAVAMVIEDDGPGIAPEMVDAVRRRGVRADEQVGGSGLGLAIVTELAVVYGGSLDLSRSARLGGLRTQLVIPISLPEFSGAPALPH
jgi:signal transduction histidine kinase